MANSEWNNMPTPIPKLVQIATLLSYLKLCLVIKAKSGPGLATANKCKIAIKKANKIMKKRARILVRKSGTEPKIRIMAESDNKTLIFKCIKLIKQSIK